MPSLLGPRGSVRIVIGLLLVVLLQFPTAAAKEPDDASGNEVRIFAVGALTAARYEFIGEHRPPVGPDDVTNENHPLFGHVFDEPIYPFGDVDDVMSLVRRLAAPDAWKDKDDAYLVALGEHAILAKHRPQVLDEAARVIAGLERRALTTVTVEVRAVRTPADKGEADAPGSRDDGGGPRLALRGFMGQRISGFNGSQSAYVQDYDVEVAKGATASDPIVGVANLGLRADVRVLPSAGGRGLLIDLRAWHAATAATRDVSTGAQRSIEIRDFDVTVGHGVVEARPGVWTAVAGRGGDGGWSFFVRATPHAWEATPAKPPSLRLPSSSGETRSHALHDVRDLAMLMPSRMESPTYLVPSNYTPPEPTELPDPTASLETEALIAVLNHASPVGVWTKPTLNEVQVGMLYAHNTPNVLAGVTNTVAALRRQFLVSVHTRADLVELPAALLERLRAADGVSEALERALKDGSARRVDRLDLVSRPGARNAITSGRRVSYLADYEIEISDGASIANPVTQHFLAGAQLGLSAHLTGDGKGVALDVQFVRSNHATPIRRVETPSGNLMMPELRVFRLRTGVVLPLGRSVLLGVQGDGPTRRALLLTARLVRRP